MKNASWVNILIGIWLIVAPWVIGYSVGSARAEDVLLGIAISLVALWSLSVTASATTPGWVNLILGIWVAIAPWAIGYSALAGRAATNAVIMGILVIIFSAMRIASSHSMPTLGHPMPRQ
jgi:hypothetical protein